MSSKIFEEAIADAKKLREVAEDNAKKAILEAVTPKIREFIEGQLLENEEDSPGLDEEDDIEEIGLDEDVFLDEAALGSLVQMLGGTDILPALQEANVQNAVSSSIRAAVDGLSAAQQQKLLEIANKINNTVDNLTGNEINNKVVKNEEKSVMASKNFYEVDLQALREALAEEAYGINEEEGEFDEGDSMMEWGLDEESAADAEKAPGGPPDVSEIDAMDEMLSELKLVLDLGDDLEAEAIPEDLRGMIEDDEEEGEDVDVEDEEDDSDEQGGETDDPFAAMGDEEAPPAEESFVVDANMLREELSRV